ncbi:hypothetical protein WJX74_006425 [Apatococcus lobatus]|uniref:Uncharacterized protein n=1 Tax=Apatococcus lobatus TaxID=904363 RepID=A0AAW1QZR0_9CHLO
MTRGVPATRRQVRAATGSQPKPAEPPRQMRRLQQPAARAAEAAAATNAGLQRAVAQTNQSHRRDASLSNVRAIAAHGSLTGEIMKVPAGKSVIVLTPPGHTSTTLNNLFLRTKEDVNRLVVGHLRPGNQDIYVKRFDAGQRMPDMSLAGDHRHGVKEGNGGKRMETGVYKLPFTAADFARRKVEGGVVGGGVERISALPDHPVSASVALSTLLANLPDGKYIVTGCRAFKRGTALTDERKKEIVRMEMETPAAPGRSDPGSLTVGEAEVPESARSVNWLGSGEVLGRHYESLWPHVRLPWQEGVPVHKSKRAPRPRM